MKGTIPPGTYFFEGNEAVVEGAIAAGCRYYAGYPITPTNEIMERFSWRLKEVGGVFMQMEDEIASICSVVGAVWAGAKAMTATSGPGFDLMMEGRGMAVATETPLVMVNFQRVGPSSGQPANVSSGDVMQAKWGSHGDYEIILISPWSVQEVFDQIINAFNLAERYRVPVVLLGEETVAHLWERVDVREKIEIVERVKKLGAAHFGTEEDDGVPPMAAFGDGEKLMVNTSMHDDYGFRKGAEPLPVVKLTRRLHNKIVNNREKIIEYDTYYMEDAEVVVVCYGFTGRSSLFAIEKMRREGEKVGMLRLKTLWPFADWLIRDIGSKAKKILVPEMNMGQIAGEVTKYTSCEVISYTQTTGRPILPSTIIDEVRRLL